MTKEIRMPAGGQTTDVSVVGTWLVKCGDKVKRGDALLEIETDKATLTVESYAKGTVLALLAKEGDRIPSGEVIALIGDENDREEALRQDENVQAEEEEYQPIDKTMPRRRKSLRGGAADCSQYGNAGSGGMEPDGIKAMPNAKLLAKKNHISLNDVAEAAGKSVLKRQDVEAYLEGVASRGPITVPFTNMRRIIARRMLESVQNIPVFAATVEIDMTQCIAFRKLINSAGDDKKVSYNDILFKCIASALCSYPYVNAFCRESEIILHRDVNIGLAVSVEGGLLVPVVHKVQEKSISRISECSREMVKKARAGKLAGEEMSKGTITLSNLGMYPVTQFTAIINPPQVCILAVGAIEEKAVFAEGTWKSVPVMKVTGSFDHRVIDGAYAARFLAELKKITENPALALV